jgi:hypothetical protein
VSRAPDGLPDAWQGLSPDERQELRVRLGRKLVDELKASRIHPAEAVNVLLSCAASVLCLNGATAETLELAHAALDRAWVERMKEDSQWQAN